MNSIQRSFVSRIALLTLCFGILSLATIDPCFASFESSLVSIKTKLTSVVLPILSVIGLGFAAISFVTGNPNAKTHATYSVIGAVIGFGAQAIIDFIASTVR